MKWDERNARPINSVRVMDHGPIMGRHTERSERRFRARVWRVLLFLFLMFWGFVVYLVSSELMQ